jgi:hypothetical protein
VHLKPEEIQSLLPPIILSVGAILPFLIASPPFSVQERARILLVCLMTLVIWLGYWMAYAFGQRPFISLYITGILVLIALALLLTVFHVAQIPAKQVIDDKGNKVSDENKDPVQKAPIDQPFWLWAYLIALLILSVAAAFYVGPKDRVIVEIQYKPFGSEHGGTIEEVDEDTGAGSPLPLDIIKHGSKAEIILTKEEFAAVKMFRVKVAPGPGKEDLNLFGYTAHKTEVLTPSLARRFRIVTEK